MDFTLRPFRTEDVDSLVKHANNYNIARFMADMFPYPYTHEAGRAFIEHVSAASPHNILAIEVNNEAAGAIGIHPKTGIERKNAEMGYWLAESYWGHGIITRAVVQMVEYSFQNFDINRIFARPFGSNIASQKVLEKAGFALEAKFKKTFFKFDRYEDEMVYAIRR